MNIFRSFSENTRFALYSDTGLCGSYNNFFREADFFLGNKKQQEKNFLGPLGTLKNFLTLVRQEQKGEPIFFCHDLIHSCVKTLKLSDFYSRTRTYALQESENPEELLQETFLSYVYWFSIFNENFGRVGSMKSSIENGNIMANSLRVRANRARQESINAEMNIIFSTKEEE